MERIKLEVLELLNISAIKETIISIYDATYNLFSSIIEPIAELALKLLIDHPMLQLTLAFVPTILTIAYPLILQTISNIDTKYGSTHILQLFKKEKTNLWLIWMLRISVGLTLLSFLLFVWLFALTFISVISLIVILFFFFEVLLTYQNGHSLSNRIIDFYRQKRKHLGVITYRNHSEFDLYWDCLSDLFIYGLKKGDDNLCDNIKDEIIIPHVNELKDCADEVVLIPNQVFNNIFRISAELLKIQKPRYNSLLTSIYYNYLNSEDKFKSISGATYRQIWRQLVVIIESGRYDIIESFWSRSHYYLRDTLRVPGMKFDSDFNESEERKILIEKFEKERKRFIEFHVGLGSYLLYKRNYDLINKIWHFTGSYPPQYHLLYKDVKSIIDLYKNIFKSLGQNKNIVLDFWFYDLEYDDLGTDETVKKYLLDYLIYQFLRLFTVFPDLRNANLAIPKLGENRIEKSDYAETLRSFLKRLRIIIKSEDILASLGIKNRDIELLENNKIKEPIKYIEDLINGLTEDIEVSKSNQEIDESRKQAFIEDTKNFIIGPIKNILSTSRIKPYSNESTEQEGQESSDKSEIEKNNFDSFYLRGSRMFQPREAFIEDQLISYFSSDSILGEYINKSLINTYASIFVRFKSIVKYEITISNLFSAVDKLKIDGSDYVMIAFGLNFNYIKESFKLEIEEITHESIFSYNGINIHSFPTSYPIAHKCMFIINKSELPFLELIHWRDLEEADSNERIKEYWQSITEYNINGAGPIFIELFDLNKDITRAQFVNIQNPDENIIDKVELVGDFLLNVSYIADSSIVKLQVAEEFKEGLSIDNINDIDSL